MTNSTPTLAGVAIGPIGDNRFDRPVRAHETAVLLGWELPAEVTGALATWHAAEERATSITARPPFSGADLSAKDWATRLEAAVLDSITLDARRQAAKAAADELRVDVGRACAEHLAALGDFLEDFHREHYEDFLAVERGPQPTETLAAIERRETLVRDFHNAHDALMAAGAGHGGAVKDYRAQWWTLHTFTPRQWQTVVENTGPNLDCPRPLALIQQVGATPRLARSTDQPWTDFVAMQQPVDDEARAEAFTRTTVVGARW